MIRREMEIRKQKNVMVDAIIHGRRLFNLPTRGIITAKIRGMTIMRTGNS
jgi:hypothetical protein